MHTPTHSTELVIQGDQVYSRDSFMTPVGGINQLIQEHLSKGLASFINLKLPPLLSKWTTGTWIGELNKTLLAFCQIDSIPLKGSQQYKQSNDTWTLHLGPIGDNTDHYRPHINDPKMYMKYPTFVMIPFKIRENALTDPFLFSVIEGKARTLNLPNIFETGRICTGHSYSNRNDAEILKTDKQPLVHIKYGLNQLHEAPVNGDLRGNDREFLQWDDEGNQKDIEIQVSHTHTITDDRIIQFVKWRSENGIV